MSISPLPASHSTMALMVATNSAPARPASDMGADNGARQGREDDEQFVSALQAASSSKSADDATISENDSSEGPKTRAKPEKAREEDSGRRAVLAQPWHTTMTGMPAPDAAGALALPASLLAHGQLALGTGASGDINADAPPVAVVGIGVVTEQEGVVTGPVLNPATLALGAKAAGAPAGLTGPGGFAALAGLPAQVETADQGGVPGQPGAAAAAGDAVPAAPRAFGLPSLTVVPAAEARPAVEAAITANADSAAAAAALAEVDLAALTDALHAGVPGAVVADELAAGAAVPGGVVGGAPAGTAGADAGGAGAAGGAAAAARGAFDLAGLAGLTGDATTAIGALGSTERRLSPAELAATQATAAQNAAAQVAAVQATAAQLGQFLQGDVGVAGVGDAAGAVGAVGAVGTLAPGEPIPAAPPGLPGYVPGAAGPGTAGDSGGETARDGEKSSAETLAATDPSAVPVAPETPAFTPLHAPDLSQPQQLDLSGATAPDQTPAPPPSAQVADQIIPLRAQGDGVHRIAMELRPDDLGTISVVAEIRNGQVHLHFGGANEMTREALRAALPDLRQQLEDAGFTGAAFDFNDGSAAGQNDRRGFGGAGAGGGADQGSGGRPGQSGTPGQPGGTETNQQRPGFSPPPTSGSGRHALDLQV